MTAEQTAKITAISKLLDQAKDLLREVFDAEWAKLVDGLPKDEAEDIEANMGDLEEYGDQLSDIQNSLESL